MRSGREFQVFYFRNSSKNTDFQTFFSQTFLVCGSHLHSGIPTVVVGWLTSEREAGGRPVPHLGTFPMFAGCCHQLVSMDVFPGVCCWNSKIPQDLFSWGKATGAPKTSAGQTFLSVTPMEKETRACGLSGALTFPQSEQCGAERAARAALCGWPVPGLCPLLGCRGSHWQISSS